MAYPQSFNLPVICLNSVRAGLRSTRTPATPSTWQGWRREACTLRRRRCSVCGRGPCPAPRRAHRWTPRALAATQSSPCTSSSRDSLGWRYELSSHLSLQRDICSLVALSRQNLKVQTFGLHCLLVHFNGLHGFCVKLLSRTKGAKCFFKLEHRLLCFINHFNSAE